MPGYAPLVKWDTPTRTKSAHCTACPWSHSCGDMRAIRRHVIHNRGHKVEVVTRTSVRLRTDAPAPEWADVH